MRLGSQLERLIVDVSKVEFTEDQAVVSVDFVNLGTATAYTGMNSEDPFTELAPNQAGGYSVGEGRIYEDGFIKVSFSAVGTKKVVAIITKDKGESQKVC